MWSTLLRCRIYKSYIETLGKGKKLNFDADVENICLITKDALAEIGKAKEIAPMVGATVLIEFLEKFRQDMLGVIFETWKQRMQEYLDLAEPVLLLAQSEELTLDPANTEAMLPIVNSAAFKKLRAGWTTIKDWSLVMPRFDEEIGVEPESVPKALKAMMVKLDDVLGPVRDKICTIIVVRSACKPLNPKEKREEEMNKHKSRGSHRGS